VTEKGSHVRVRVVFTKGWEQQVYRTTETRRAVALAVRVIEAHAKGGAPRRRGSAPSWNSIARQIGSAVHMDAGGWYGGVFTEVDPKVWHAMLLELGFTDRGGRKHPGRRWLKSALLRSRISQ
jgi:hypothetical protein